MKDVVLASSPGEIDSAIARVDALDGTLRQLFDLVRERFLGDKKMVETAVQAYEDWKPMRAEVTRLSRAGQRAEAEALLKGGAAQKIQDLRQKMDVVRTWARERAEKFMGSASATSSGIETQLIWLLVLALLVSVLAAWIITRSISRPVAALTRTMAEIQSGHADITVPEQNRGDELGALARGLEELRKSVEDAFRLNQMVEGQPAAVMLCTPDLKISYANQAAKDILKLMERATSKRPSDAVGRSVPEFHQRQDAVRRILTDIDKLPYKGKFSMAGVTIENWGEQSVTSKGASSAPCWPGRT